MAERSAARKQAAPKTGIPKTAARKPVRQQPKSQRAAVPSKAGGGARRRPATGASPARQDPPIPVDLISHFGGQPTVDLIVHECVPSDASAGDVLRLLLEARRRGADPLRYDVYLAREGSRDGGARGYAVAAKRDCLLRYANRLPDFLGHDEAPIYEKDVFKRGKPQPEAQTLAERVGIEHETGMPGLRGEVVGAWAAAEMRGKPPTVRILEAAKYLGDTAERNALDPNDARARYPDGCMIAAAMSNVLRIACGLNDVVGAEELSRRPDPAPALGGLAGQPVAPAVFPEGPTDDIDARILDAYTQAQALDRLMWPPAKVSAHLASAVAAANNSPTAGPATIDDLREKLAADIERDVAAEVAHRRDPQANARRLAELRAFDATDLDAETLIAYRTELAAVEAAVEANATAADATATA
jgi:hypothetical protein